MPKNEEHEERDEGEVDKGENDKNKDKKHDSGAADLEKVVYLSNFYFNCVYLLFWYYTRFDFTRKDVVAFYYTVHTTP